ncbi:MAG: IS3 family transposase [Candidatus Micrarchaeaceae archaeon]
MTSPIKMEFKVKNESKLSGYPRSLFYYKKRERIVPLNKDLSSKIEDEIIQRPSYRTRRVTAMIRRSGLIVNRKKVRRYMKALNLLHRARKRFRKSVPRTMVVSRTNIF